ncbi:WxL domain-containing protein [Enterococcus faecalis]|uniref:WxL domain-containing protein n=1 Tax=Enterococcus faecalis TaxID=1351 RepID=UPI001E4A70D8|nr:WxL domain-containing protein [Enterococcus faecalis]MCD4928273.1 WxL domain-containing protein [Enterococcus faecalis]MCD5177658.1 WxL domain-containing protein [Enterococcus faecalis]MDQ4453306.1 WxL domain-containing protein [Enterococcus faecalis]WCG24880.1 WxL domain-containing protein [Enterococcus faecalis]
MKQTKWQRLATIGLCSSLVINAFSGVTAVAETITIESSPTVASSAKEATSASSATPASTESSQETTETSREEVTQETEKQEVVKEEHKEETEAKKQEEETVTSEVVQPNPVLAPTPVSGIGVRAGNLDSVIPILNSLIIGNKQYYASSTPITFPSTTIGMTLKPMNGESINVADFGLTADATTIIASKTIDTYVNNAVTQQTSTGFDVTLPAIKINFFNKSTRHSLDNIILKVPKYIDNISSSGNGLIMLDYKYEANVQLWNMVKKVDASTYKIHRYYNSAEYSLLDYFVGLGNFNVPTSRMNVWAIIPEKNLDLIVTHKKVTESFKDTAGATIPAPTGFTQGKQTSITSNNYTFKQAGTLPETYKASNGKTYKFKGWYKGKTKPNTLTTTKAPSYGVTYDDNDDLNVVYEEMVPQDTWIYPGFYAEFVDENGQAFNEPLTFSGNYTQFLRKVDNTIDPTGTRTPIVGTKDTSKNNRYKIGTQSRVTMPANFYTQVSDIYNLRGYTIDNISITNTLNYVDKIEATTTEIPVARYPIGYVGVNPVFNNGEPTFLNAVDKGFKKGTDNKFTMKTTFGAGSSNTTYPRLLRVAVSDNPPEKQMVLIGFDGTSTYKQTMNYKVTRKQVTEKFVNTSGVAITPPTGFTQNKKTPMTSNAFAFKQAGTLPDTYTTGGKTYKFKGWYKGKIKPNTLTTTKAPSYAVTYNDDDDLNVVYEEVTETAVYPGFYAQFVDEQGKAFTNPLTFSGNYTEYLRKTGTTVFETAGAFYPMIGKRDATVTNKYKIETTSSVAVPNNFWTPMPADIGNRGYALNNLDITNQMKYVDKIEATDTRTTMYDYAGIADIGVNLNNTSQTELNAIDKTFVKQANSTFSMNTKWGDGTFSQIVPRMLLLGEISRRPRLFGFDGTPDYKHTMNYTVTRKQVTENFVDTNGTKITPPTGFTQGNQIPMTSNTFKYTAAKALPATYTAGGKTYTFQGWYKGKTKPNTLTTSTTPTYNTTFDGNDDMTAMYKEEVPKASVALTRTTAETVTSGGNVTWRATITNTSQAPLTTATIKKSTAWTTGLAAPTAMIVTPAGGTAKTVPVTTTTWTNGVSLGTDIPVGKSATVQFTTKATGTAGQVLRAGITTSGNYSGVSTSATVRVKDNDQAIVTPTAEGFISVPTFNFGQVGVAGSTQQHGLKKAADYYGNGTRNPYLRIKKTQANWSLTAQLSQPKSATDSLPTATRLLLGAAPVSSFSNYNQPTELKNAVGTTSAISLNANNTATRIIANQQFTGSNIYQLDFTFNNVKLEVPANQGVKGQQYQAAVTWNLVTGP